MAAGYDLSVAKQAYQTASSMGASAKVMLALFEAGIVESGFRNLSSGDADSAGFLQQRPSQGWGTKDQVMNVAYATTKFVTEAKKLESQTVTSGQLAQAVQRSAFPARYDAAGLSAQALLKQVQSSTPVTLPAGNVDSSGTSTTVNSSLGKITDPHTWLRLATATAGGVLVMVSLAMLGWDNAPDSAKTLAKTAAKAAATAAVA